MSGPPICTKVRTSYLSRFAVLNLCAFRPHFRYGRTLGKGEGVWRNVAEHCLLAGVYAALIAQEVGLPEEEVRRITHASILHDWCKPDEVLACRQARSRFAQTRGEGREECAEAVRRAIEQVSLRSAQSLRTMGFEEAIIALSSANVLTDASGPQTDAARIVFFVDQMLQGAKVVSHAERLRGSYGDISTNDALWSEACRKQLNGESLDEAEARITPVVAAVIARRVGYAGKLEDLPFYFQAKLEERVRRWAASEEATRGSSGRR